MMSEGNQQLQRTVNKLIKDNRLTQTVSWVDNLYHKIDGAWYLAYDCELYLLRNHVGMPVTGDSPIVACTWDEKFSDSEGDDE